MAEALCTCPKCGGDIVESAKAFGCANWRDADGGCKHSIWKNTLEKLGHAEITKTEAKQLFTKGRTTKKVALHSAAKNKDFEAFLVLDDSGERPRVELSFE